LEKDQTLGGKGVNYENSNFAFSGEKRRKQPILEATLTRELAVKGA
jgi:hypothetical protein